MKSTRGTVGTSIMVMSVPSTTVAGSTVSLELHKISECESIPKLLPVGLILYKILI